jgi:2-polyprenyl-3-methyl-5-hydroxy-6-metoxy-1,4-benzoquinol methylase
MSQPPDAARPLFVRIAARIPYLRPAVRSLQGRYRSWQDWYRNWRLTHARTVKNITRKNTLRAYNRVYRSDSLLAEYLAPGRLEFYEEVAEICAPLAPRRLVDVGCGNGQLIRFLVDRMPASPELVVGIDRSRAGIRKARTLVPEGTFVVADLYRLQPDHERFDLVLCTEVLEHVHEPAPAVEVLRGLCAPGGRIAITVPDGAQDSWEGHVNFWTEDELQAFLAPFGLAGIDRIQEGGVLLAWLTPDRHVTEQAQRESAA